MRDSKSSTIFMNPKGWIEVVWGAVIDQDVYISIAKQMLDMVTAMNDELQDPLMLIDFSELKVITADAAALAASATRDLGCKKIAGFGIKPQFKGILDTIKKNSTKADTIKEFQARDAAEKWLLEK